MVNVSDSISQPQSQTQTSLPRFDQLTIGAFFGSLSAVGYTAANVCLRAVTNCDPIWVSTIKAMPTVVLVGPWLLVLLHRGLRVLPTHRTLWAIVLAGLFGQLAGNVLFQWSLGVIGIALVVPITLGTIIVMGAIMGRAFLHESITPRTAVALVILIAAIGVLSAGAGSAHQSLAGDGDQPVSGWARALTLSAGVAAAAIAGLAYSVLGVVIRYGVSGRAPISTVMTIIALVGMVGLGLLSWLRIGMEGMLGTTSTDLGVMILAGLFNAFAFLSLIKALQLTTVTYVNALNASQAAMAATAGVLFFGEAMTGSLVLGVALTAVGLMLKRAG